MKLLNYDTRTLVYQNLRSIEKQPVTGGYTQSQYKILCNLIQQKSIEKKFFNFLLMELYDLSDWKELTYEQMYELIHILTFWNSNREREEERMSELLKIYESVIKNEEEAVNMEKRVTKEVDRLTEKYQKQFNADELEELQDIMFSIALTSQHEAFQLGAKYFAKLLAECLS